MRDSVNKPSDTPGTPKKAKALSCVAIIAVLVATLWPFNPRPRNGITWLQRTNGLRFQKAGLLVSSEALRLPDTDGTHSYTLELLLRPAAIRFPHTILTFFRATDRKQLTVRQWKDSLLVTHDVRVDSDSTGKVKLSVGRVFRSTRLVFIAVSSGQRGTTVYVEGEPTDFFPRFDISPVDLSGEIVIGTSPTSYDPWAGELRGFAIYGKELSAKDALQHYRDWVSGNAYSSQELDGAFARYAFTEGSGTEVHNQVASGPSLRIPLRFSVPHKRFLESPVEEFRPSRGFLFDVGTNIAGFMPLGIVLCSLFAWTRNRRNAILATVLLCGLLSFMIEVLQYYIPKRGSGITDIITNTVGGAFGAMLLQSVLVRELLVRIGLLPAQNKTP